MMAAFVMLSGMMLTGGSMQIYGDDNRSFESCQFDLESQAMKTSMKIYSWQACVRADMHTRTWTQTHTQIIHNPPQSA